MIYLLAVVLTVVALVIGLVANRWWQHSARAAGDDGLAISDLVVPITTLAVVLLAFAMVEGIGSYGRARTVAADEARVLDLLSDETLLLEDRAAAIQLRQVLLCYARAVRFQEWPEMAGGRAAPAATLWAGAVRDQIIALQVAGEDQADRLLDSQASLGQARSSRLTEANPTIPQGLNWLMFGSVIVSVLGLALFIRPQGSAVVHIAVLAVFTLLTAATLWTISDLDRPFTGFNAIEPTEIARIQPTLEAELARLAPGAVLPCNAEGTPSSP